MIWIAWRRLRSIIIASAIAVAVVVAVALSTGRTAQRLGNEYLHAPCHGGGWSTANNVFCSKVAGEYYSLRGGQGNFILAVIVVALAIASVLGAATVAAEFDRGTVRWAWTQSRSRRRWWGESSMVALAGTALLVAPLALIMSWWEGAVSYGTRFDSQVFLVDGWILLAYALLVTSFTLAAGLLVRHPGWLVVFGILVGMGTSYTVNKEWRTDLVATRTSILADKVVNGNFDQLPNVPYQSDVYYSGFRPTGQSSIPSPSQSTTFQTQISTCSTAVSKVVLGKTPRQSESNAQSAEIETTCEHQLGLQLVEVYIPEGEFWALQDREGAMVLGASALLWWSGWWWVRRTRA